LYYVCEPTCPLKMLPSSHGNFEQLFGLEILLSSLSESV
jgi:hypothetical protein